MTPMDVHSPPNSSRTPAGEIWRRLPRSTAPMRWQLPRTEALFDGLAAGAPPTIRWYIPARPALVLGRSQCPGRADLAAARAAGVVVHRRTSGGGAVLVDDAALSLDIALPAGHPLALTDLTRSYEWIGRAWADALHQLGIPGARAIPTAEARALAALPADDPLRLACFGTLSPYEVVVGQRKVVGLSQIRRRPGAIYAIGVHLRWRPARLTALLALDPPTRAALTASLATAAAGLDELAGRPVAVAEVIPAVERALIGQLGITLRPGPWLTAERAAAARMPAARFWPVRLSSAPVDAFAL